MGALRALAAAIGFLTLLPLGRSARPEDLRRGVAAFPLVGLVLGGVLAGAWLGLELIFPRAVSAACLLALEVWLTGGLHLDGLMDTADGVFSGRPRERALEIMRDSRVGAQGVLAALTVALVRFAVFLSLPRAAWPVLAAAPLAGRWNMTVALTSFPYARPQGLGSAFLGAGARERGWALCWTLLGLAGLAGVRGLAAGAGTTLAGWWMCRRLQARLGGLTGDTYGAVAEVGETVFLLLALVAAGLPGGAAWW